MNGHTRRRPRGMGVDAWDGADAFADDVAPADEGLIEDLTARLRRARRERGPERADREWMDGPLDDWLDHLDDRDADLDGDVMARLAVGMNETLSIRDALILSLIVDGDECDRDVMMDIIARPRAPEVAATVRDLMLDSLDGEREPDLGRCRTGLAMFDGMGLAMPRRLTAQPLASIAYILWWLDDRRAPIYAIRSLEADGSCSLASIVLGASEHGVRPSRRR